MEMYTEGKVKKGGVNTPPTSPRPNIKPAGQATVGFMQIVPGSFKPYPCECDAKMGDKHKANCPVFYFDFDARPVIRAQGEQCGRCWQNHTPGFVCMCDCHSNIIGSTTTPMPDNGDDLDAPQNT